MKIQIGHPAYTGTNEMKIHKTVPQAVNDLLSRYEGSNKRGLEKPFTRKDALDAILKAVNNCKAHTGRYNHDGYTCAGHYPVEVFARL